MLFALLFPQRAVKSSRRKGPRRLFESLESRHLLSSAPVIDLFRSLRGLGTDRQCLRPRDGLRPQRRRTHGGSQRPAGGERIGGFRRQLQL